MDRDTARNIEWDCTQLLTKFYNLLDAKHYRNLSELFAADGVWVRLGIELKGPQAILDAMTEREDWLTAHLLTNVEVTIKDPNHAETVQYITLYRIEGYDPAQGPASVALPMGILRHRDQLIRIDGNWKFKRKESRAILVNRQRITHYDKP
jgi:hypothetical protein